MKHILLTVLLGIGFLQGCVQHVRGEGDARLSSMPMLDALPICHGFGCSIATNVSLSSAEWASITAIFEPPVQTPAQERARVARAVGQFEVLVGKKAGTSSDRARADLIENDPSQQDCIDEALNTTLFLRLIDTKGLLRFHKPAKPANRGDGLTRWFHNTGVLSEIESGKSYAIDTWFLANGENAFVVPLEEWRDGWQPPQS